MKKTGKITVFLLLAAFTVFPALSAPATAYATGVATPTPTDADLQDVYDAMNRLQSEMADLQSQINQQSSAPLPTTPEPVYAPKVKLISPFSVVAAGGKSQDVEITVKNLGTSYAANVLTQANAGDAPFTLSFPDGSNAFDRLAEGKTHTMRMKITVDAGAKAGSYAVTLTHSYKDAANKNLTETDTLTIKINAEVQQASLPNIILRNLKADREPITQGDTVTITGLLDNTGAGAANDAQITIEGFDANVYLTGDAASLFYKTLEGGSQTAVKIAVKVTKDAKAGTYPLTFKIKYKDSAGTAADNTFVYYLNVNSPDKTDTGAAKVEIVSVSQPGGAFGVAQEFTFNVKLVNNGSAAAKQVKVVASSADGGIVPKSANTQLAATLAVGESLTFPFVFAATAKAESQNYMVSFKLTYETGKTNADGAAEVVTVEQFAGANVSNPTPSPSPTPTTPPDTSKISKPKIIIDSYVTDPQIVKAGQNFNLKLTFKNTHKTKEINNIKIVLAAMETTDQKGSVFTPVSGSNTVYIDGIAPEATYEKNLTMFVVPDAKPRTYTIAVTYNYQDAEFNNYDESETIGISVKQVTKLETGEIYIPTDASVGQPISLSFSIINSGKVDLSNLRIKVEADSGMDTANANTFLGSIKIGASTYFDGFMTPTEPGTITGKLIISGEDDTGEAVSIEKEFSINVMGFDMGGEGMGEAMFGENGGEMAPEGEGGIMSIVTTWWFLLIVGVVLVGVIILVVKLAAKAHKKRMDEDE